MAVDVGLSGNTSRYWSVPDSAGLTLPNSDWSWLTLIYPQDAVSTKYIISKGLYFDTNSFNLIVYSSDTGLGLSTQVHVLDGVIFTSTLPANQWYWAYATRRSGVLKLGYCPVGSSSVSEIGNVAISAEYNSSSPLEIGRRSDGEPTRYWQGRYSKAIFTPGYSVSKDEIAALCKGVLPEDMELSSFIRFYADFEHANKSVIVDRTGRYALTRNGTGWGANQKDPATRPRNVLLFNPSLVGAPASIVLAATPSSSLTATGNLSTSIALAASPSASLASYSALNTQITLSTSATTRLTSSAQLTSSQFLRPNGNVLQSSWTGGYVEIDETVASDADFAYSANNYVGVLEVALTDPGTPISGTKTIRYRIARTNNGALDGAGFPPKITARLYQGSTLISSDAVRTPDGTWTTCSWNPDTSAVTNWADLRLNFETEVSGPTGAYGSAAYKVGGYPGTHEATWTSGSAANYSAALVALHGGNYVAPTITSEPTAGTTVSPIPSTDKFYKTVGADTLFLRLLQSQSIYTPNTAITKAVIAVHGSSRDANRAYANANALAGGASNIVVVAPDFLDSTSTTPAPESDQLSWGSSWPQGGLSVSGPPFRVSSHQIIEDLITQLRSNFVNLNLVYVIGHSAGGQYAQRFAMTNNDPTRVRILVCNPSSYAYPGNLRWDGSAYTNPGIVTCPTYNDWKYGTDNLTSVSYVDGIGATNLINRLGAANVLYLAGELDTDTADPDLDTTCPANLQGSYRLDRALKYYGYLGQVYGNTVYSKHHFDIVPDSAHTEWKMLTSPQAQAWVVNDTAPSVPSPALVRQSIGILAVDASSLTITTPHTSTSGNCLVATVALRTDTGRQVGSVTDTAGNTWVKAIHSNPGTASSTRTEIWYCAGANPVTSVTVNITGGAAIRCAALISEYSGVARVDAPIKTAVKSEASVTSIETNPAFVFTRGALLIGSVNSSVFGDRRSVDAASNFIALKDYSAPSSSVDTRGVGLSWAEMEIPQAAAVSNDIAANASASVTASGALSTQISLSALSSASLSASGGINTSIALAATSSSSLTASGALNTSIRFAAATTASLSALSGLFTQINLASSSTASLSSSGSLNASIVFSASPSISLSASASLLALSSGLSANPVATLTASGSLSTSIYLSGSCNASLSASASLLAGSGNFASSASASLTASGALSTQITLSATSSVSVSSSASIQFLASNLASSASVGVVSSASLLTGIRLQTSPNFSVSAIAGWGFTSGPAGSGYKAGLVKSSRNPVISKLSRNISNRSRPTYQ